MASATEARASLRRTRDCIGASVARLRVLAASEAIGRTAPVVRERVVPGAHVTAAWGSGTPWHATVVTREGDQVTLQWHDGSSPSAVSIAQIIDVWDAI